ncbi:MULTISPECIES: MBL fold metallo-hydrolase [unclassified Pseudescherichia]|uniref:MBL fold metallo-hydrolase n=1 Tax=Pseudescherichia TaxID=2055880 RepID=UPI00289E5336|nr:MBL fold metallo-hydrolase [Pseudescherichia sp.]WPO96956.1 MBL fold metallo-hydrolase [Buttiauxella sp. HR94]
MAWKNPWYNPALTHHTPQGFRNLTPGGHQPGDVERWQKERRAAGLPHPPEGGYDTFLQQRWQRAEIGGSGDGVWWLGHASMLLRLDGCYLLADPLFFNRASPVRFTGPQRKSPAPLNVNDLPALDAILISHNHYDHLDTRTIRALLKRFPDVTLFVPLGLGRWCRRHGVRHVVELDWWQSFTFQGMTLSAVPAQHWSMRTPWDRDRSLWCGWVVESRAHRFWFAGDTGYTPDLLAIPERLGKLDSAALPVGAYAPRWFMSMHHMDPQHAVSLWQQIGEPLAFPIHWGVFELADEAVDEPARELAAVLNETVTQTDNFRILKIGEYLSLDAQTIKQTAE